MITHGNKQISEIVYARKASDGGGAVRLTNIIRGAQVVFGGLKQKVALLMKATKAAILAAFGQTDGYAVIKATNAYLNALDATDPTKAFALAGFINEDPMMVCSLGIQPQGVTMPIRWLVGDGTATVTTSILAYPSTKIHMVYLITSFTTSNKKLIVSGKKWNSLYTTYGLYINSSSKRYFNAGETRELNTNISLNTVYDLQLDASKTTCTINGNVIGKSSFPGTVTDSGFIHNIAGRTQFIEINEHKLVPFIGTHRNGMVDLTTADFCPNSGNAFTDAYTFQDGVTTWTPLNQTP